MSALARSYSPLGSPRARRALSALVRSDAWTLGLFGLLAALFLFTLFIQPNYGARDFSNLALAALPVVFAAVGQAIVVISGGIDLSIASVMALTNVTAARLMVDASPEQGALIVIGVLLMGVIVGAINGGLVVLTRVPDIIVTLAMLFVWAGAALLVLNAPGGSVVGWLRDLTRGNIVGAWIPNALVLVLVVVGAIWLPLRRSRLGLTIYAVGSDRQAAFRSDVNVALTKVVAYALTGFFAAAGGLAINALTGQGAPIPGPYLLQSVAAVVLGGVSLAGGRGGLLGPIVAVYILALVRTDLTLLGIDPNWSAVIQGTVLVLVVMAGAYLTLRQRRA